MKRKIAECILSVLAIGTLWFALFAYEMWPGTMRNVSFAVVAVLVIVVTLISNKVSRCPNCGGLVLPLPFGPGITRINFCPHCGVSLRDKFRAGRSAGPLEHCNIILNKMTNSARIGRFPMLTIKKWKLYLARCFLWGGLAVMIAGVPAVVWLGSLAFVMIIVGGVVGIIGAVCIDNLYRCPRCGYMLLNGGSRIGAILGKYTNYCPNCGLAITVEKIK